MAARVAAQGLPPLAHDEGADLAERPLPADRLPGDRLLLGAQAEEGRAEEPGRGRSRSCSRPTRSSASRCTSARSLAGRGGGRRVRQRLGGHHLQGRSWRRWASSSARSPRRCRSTPSWCGSSWARWCPYTDNFFAALNSAVFTDGSFCYIPKGVRCPMELSHLLPHQRRQHRAVRADADRRRGGRLRQLPRGLHGARCATRTSSTPRWSSWWRSTTRRSSTRPCRTGTRATRTARAASTTS